jgi:hypothetical protein
MAISTDDAPKVAGSIILLTALALVSYALRESRVSRRSWSTEDWIMTAAVVIASRGSLYKSPVDIANRIDALLCAHGRLSRWRVQRNRRPRLSVAAAYEYKVSDRRPEGFITSHSPANQELTGYLVLPHLRSWVRSRHHSYQTQHQLDFGPSGRRAEAIHQYTVLYDCQIHSDECDCVDVHSHQLHPGGVRQNVWFMPKATSLNNIAGRHGTRVFWRMGVTADLPIF